MDNNLVAYEMANESKLEVCYSPSLLVNVSVAEASTSVLVCCQVLPWREQEKPLDLMVDLVDAEE